MVVFLFSEVVFEVGGIGHVLNFFIFNGDCRALVGYIGTVLFVDNGGRGAETIESKKMVYDVVVVTLFVKEDVVFLGHVLVCYAKG